MLLVDMDILLWSSVSCSNLFFIICMADLTGMDVSRAETSYAMMHSPLSSLFFLKSSANSLELLTWWMMLPVRVLESWPILLLPHMSQSLCLKQWASGGCSFYVF